MVQQSGGGIRIETAVDRGTIVRIYLPRIQSDESEAPPPVAAMPATVADARPALVLIVDDDASVRGTVAEMVGSLGFSVVTAESGHRALERLAIEPRVDLVITDFAMPELNGAEVARRARLLRPGLPIVFVTGFADIENLHGEEWVLQKPFRRDGLAAKLRLALPGRADQLS